MAKSNQALGSGNAPSPSRRKILGLTAVGVLALVAILVNWWVFHPTESSAPQVLHTTVLDLQSGQIVAGVPDRAPVAASADEAAPEPQRVRAVLYSCGKCSETEAFGELVKRSPEGLAALKELRAQKMTDVINPVRDDELQKAVADGQLVAKYVKGQASPNSLVWVNKTSTEGQALEASIQSTCGNGVQPVECPEIDK